MYCTYIEAEGIGHSDLLYPPRQNINNKSDIYGMYLFEILWSPGFQICFKKINFWHYHSEPRTFWPNFFSKIFFDFLDELGNFEHF